MNNLKNMASPSEGLWLKAAVKETGMSVSEFARRAKVGRSTLHVYFLQPVLDVEIETLLNIIQTLGIKAEGLREEHARAKEVITDPRQWSFFELEFRTKIMNHVRYMTDPRWRDKRDQEVEFVMLRRIPFFDVSIAAGAWVESGTPRTADDADGWLPVPVDLPEDAFALRIRGDCMEPDFPDGSTIVFVPVRARGGMQFEPGKPHYFEHSDGKATFKRVWFEPQRERWRLEPINPKYKSLHVPEQQMARLSRAVKLIRDLV